MKDIVFITQLYGFTGINIHSQIILKILKDMKFNVYVTKDISYLQNDKLMLCNMFLNSIKNYDNKNIYSQNIYQFIHNNYNFYINHKIFRNKTKEEIHNKMSNYLKKCKSLLFVSSIVMNNFIKIFNINPSKCNYICNISKFEDTQIKDIVNKNNECFEILYVASLQKRKGFDILFNNIDIIKKYINMFFSKNININICGPNCDNNILNIIKKNKHMKYLGCLKDNELINYYKKSDAIFLFSYNEGQPLSLIEGLYFNIPLFTSDVDGILEVNIDNKTGNTFNIESNNFEEQFSRFCMNIKNYSQNNKFYNEKFSSNIIKNKLYTIFC